MGREKGRTGGQRSTAELRELQEKWVGEKKSRREDTLGKANCLIGTDRRDHVYILHKEIDHVVLVRCRDCGFNRCVDEGNSGILSE